MPELPKRKSKGRQALQYQSGQALLLVLLGMAVVLTLVLSIVSRSVTDISVTTKDTEALRAFNAAEAGVEKALIGSIGSGVSLGNDSTYTSTIGDIGNSAIYTLPKDLISGESATVWFVSHDNNGNLSCSGLPCFNGTSLETCWGKSGTVGNNNIQAPAVEVSIYYDSARPSALGGNYANVHVFRKAFDPNTTRGGSNSFSSTGTCSMAGYAFSGTITAADATPELIGCISGAGLNGGCLLFARIKMLYNTTISHPLAVRVGGIDLPAQGKQISSIGESGESTVKLQVTKTFSETPSIFESAIFSMGTNADLTK